MATTARRGPLRSRSPREMSWRPPRSSPRGSVRTAARRRETRCSSTRSRTRFGEADARRVFADLREANDPEAPVSVPGSFPQELPSATTTGSVVLDDGSFNGAAVAPPAFASNALLLGRAAFDDRASTVRGGAAGRLLLPAVLRGDGALRRRLRRPWGHVPGRAPRAGRSRAGLRLERDVVPGRRPRSLRGDALQRRRCTTSTAAHASR